MPGAVPPLTSGWQQWAGRSDRRLPLSDYNLWSISIIGGVCRDSNSNNYLDWSVSKATNIPTTLPKWREGVCLCVCVCISWRGEIREAWDLAIKISFSHTCKVSVWFLISFGLSVPPRRRKQLNSVKLFFKPARSQRFFSLLILVSVLWYMY